MINQDHWDRPTKTDQHAMHAGTQPVVYISYRWTDVMDQGRPARAPDPRARDLADKLREKGVDVRLDVYFLNNLHGFKSPQRVARDPRDPWLIWSAQQIAEADAVLMFCTPEYVDSDPNHGAKPGEWWNWCQLDEADRIATRVPALWWDWLAIARECTERPQKFIPIGIGRYHGDQIPAFVRGASYLNLSEDGTFDALLRRIRQVWRERVPRRGVSLATHTRTIKRGSIIFSVTYHGSNGSIVLSSGPIAKSSPARSGTRRSRLPSTALKSRCYLCRRTSWRRRTSPATSYQQCLRRLRPRA